MLHHLAADYSHYEKYNITPVLGRIRHFGQLGAIAHHVHKPVPYLDKSELGTFKTDGTFERRRKVADADGTWVQVKAFRRMFDQTAWNILALMHSTGHPGMTIMPEDLLAEGLGGPPDHHVFLNPPQ